MSKRILIVDDEDHIREVAATTLELLGGWEVLTAGSGRQALARAIAEQPDAILLDVMMPDMDGATAFALLQAEPATRHIPVLLLTARVQPSDRRRLGELGVKGLIAKPFDPKSLPSQLADALGWTADGKGGRSTTGRRGLPADVAAAIVTIREEARETFERQIGLLEEAALAARVGVLDEDLRRKAHHEAHKLAGSLGPVGLGEASSVAQEIELLLEAGRDGNGSGPGVRRESGLSELVARLRNEFERR